MQTTPVSNEPGPRFKNTLPPPSGPLYTGPILLSNHCAEDRPEGFQSKWILQVGIFGFRVGIDGPPHGSAVRVELEPRNWYRYNIAFDRWSSCGLDSRPLATPLSASVYSEIGDAVHEVVLRQFRFAEELRACRTGRPDPSAAQSTHTDQPVTEAPVSPRFDTNECGLRCVWITPECRLDLQTLPGSGTIRVRTGRSTSLGYEGGNALWVGDHDETISTLRAMDSVLHDTLRGALESYGMGRASLVRSQLPGA